MKLVIDISKEIYDGIKMGMRNTDDMAEIGDAVENGTPLPDNATNGDVIKTLFPDIEIADTSCLNRVYTGIPFGKYIGANIDCMREWWNAPYKAGDADDRPR